MNPLLRFLSRTIPVRALKRPAVLFARLAGGGALADAAASLGSLELGPSVRTETAVPLGRSRVALVTTSGLFVRGDAPFRETNWSGDFGYRIIPRDTAPSRLTIGRAAIDRRLVLLDPNIVLPIERLKELKNENEIGDVASLHYSFSAWCDDYSPLAGGSAKEVARRMRYDGVDKAVIIPASLLSQESAVIVQRVIESEGIPTVSLVYGRGAAEALKPPRCVVVQGAPLSRADEYLDKGAQRELLSKLLAKFEPQAEKAANAGKSSLKI